jgi:hypothetical protein
MRIATYNVEWFHELFDTDGALLPDEGRSGREGVSRARQIEALVTVFRAIDADAIMVVEAPDISRRHDGETALLNFARHAGIRARSVLFGFPNQTQQELMLLYDPDVISPPATTRRARSPASMASRGRPASTARSASTSTSTRPRMW